MRKVRKLFELAQLKLGRDWNDAMLSKFEQHFSGNDRTSVVGLVYAVKRNVHTGLFSVIPGLNIVTSAGDRYYAERACGQAPTVAFQSGGIRLGSSTTAPTKSDTDVTTFLAGTGHAIDATYPKTADGDTDNTGSGVTVATWRFSYTTAEGNVSGIQEGAIVNNTGTPTSALTHFLFGSSFSKTSSDTLKVFVNHTFLGV